MNYVPGSSVMPFESSSRISHAPTTVAHAVEDSVDSKSLTFFDKFFLIIDELGRFSPPNSIFVFIQIFISFYQFYITSFFPFLKDAWDFSQFHDKVLRYLSYPIDFGLGDSDIFNTGIVTLLILILTLVIIIYLIAIMIYYQRNKMFPRHNAHITRFVISILIPILLFPLTYNIGVSYRSIFAKEEFYIIDNSTNSDNQTAEIITSYTINQYSDETLKNRPLYITSTIFSFIFYFFLVLIYYVDVMFRSSTPYIENTALSMWDGFPLFLSIFGSTLNIIFSSLIERFPTWTNYFLISCYILFNVYVCYQILFFPMIKQWMNVTFFSFVSSSVFSSLFQLFPIPSTYRFYVPIGIFVIHFPIVFVIFRVLRNRAVSKDIDNADIGTENKALRYLRLSIADKCAEFVTFRWIKPMNQKSTNKLLSQIAQLISFFPSESQNLTFYISILSKKNDLSLHQRFLFFQLRRVHVLRQSSTSKQLNDDLHEIAKATNQSIQSFSQFLIKIIDERQELSIDRLNGLAKLNRLTDSLCHEAMSRYPNNSRLIFTFSKYVIECHADFKGGISLYHEGQMIERGKRPTIDYAFQSMVNLFPSYLWKRILDYKGKNILNRRRSKSGSSMSVDSMANDRNNGISDTDLESNEKIASSVLENPRLRFSMRKAVNNMNSKGITVLTFHTIIRVLLSFIISMIALSYAPNFLANRSINYENIVQIGTVRKSLDLSLFRMAKLWSNSLNLSPKQSDVTSSLGPGISLDEYNNITMDPKIALVSDVVTSIREIETLGRLLSEVKYSDSMVLNDKSTTDFVQYNNISFCHPTEEKYVQSMTSLRYFSLYLLNQVAHVSRLPDLYSDPSEWKDDACICEVILNMHNIINVLNDQSTVLVNQEEDYSKAMDKQIIIFFCFALPIIFAVYIIPFIAGYVIMNSEFKQIFDVLNLLPIMIYKEASKPIALFQPEAEQAQDVAVTQIENRGCQKVIVVIPAVLCSIVITGCLAGFFYLIRDTNTKFNVLVKWLEIGSRRTPLLIETVTNSILSGIFGYVGSTNYTSHVHHLNLVYNYSQDLLYQHKTLIWGSDSSTSCNGFSERLDTLHFTNTCIINMQGESLRVNYRCLSLDQQIMTFNKFAKDVYLTMIYAQLNSNVSSDGSDDTNDIDLAFLNVLNGYEAINLHFLGITYLLPKLEDCQEILNIGINLKIDQLKNYSIIISLCTFAIEFVIFIIELFIINNLKEEFNIVRILIARLPPLSIVQNQSLVELIIGHSDSKGSNQTTPVNVHIRNCSNSIIIFNKRCNIQLVNSSTSQLFGFSKEQLYQSSISTIISKDDFLSILDKCNRNDEHKTEKKKKNKNKNNEHENEAADTNNNDSLMLESLLQNSDSGDIDLNNNNNNNNGQTSSEKVDLYKEPCQMTIVGIKDDGTKMILSAVLTYLPQPDDVYALILTDQTKLYINEEEIKRAKMRTVEIMHHVLPQAISQNDEITENISFSIKQVSVITIKLLNFNDQISHITSVQAIRSMAELFTVYDSQVLNYPSLTKTSVMSETYQTIGGLFNNNSIKKYKSQTQEMIENFSLDRNNKESETDFESAANESNTNSQANTENNSKINNSNSNNINYVNSNNNNKFNSSNSNNINYVNSNNNDNNNSNNFNNNNDNDNSNINNNNGNINNSNSNNDLNNFNSNKNNNNESSNSNNNSESNSSDNENENESTNKFKNPDFANSMGSFNDIISNSNFANNFNNMSANSVQANNSNENSGENSPSSSSRNSESNSTSLAILKQESKKRVVHSRKSIYDISSFHAHSVQFIDIVIDSINFAFDVLEATEYMNNTTQSNFVIGIGITIGGPVTAGTLGKERMKFEVVGEAIKSSYIVSNYTEAGMVLITADIYEMIKDDVNVKNNFVFSKYRRINMLHMKKIDSYIVNLVDNMNTDENTNEDQPENDN